MRKKELDALVKKVKSEYAKEWRSKNPDKVKAANRRYWERKAQREAEMQREAEYERN